MASLPELLKGPPPAAVGQPLPGAPVGQQVQGAAAPYQDPNSIPQAVGPSYGAPPQVGSPQYGQPPQAVGYQAPPGQQVAPAYGVAAGAHPAVATYQAKPYGASCGAQYQPPPGGVQYQPPPAAGGPVYQAPIGQPQYG